MKIVSKLRKIVKKEDRLIRRWPGWKHFFIPHQGNNYHPHALHLHRLAFHTLSIIVMKCIVVLTLVALPLGAYLTPDVLAERGREIVKLTNQLRQGLNVGVLSENQTLNQGALNKANDMLNAQYFAHVSPTGKGLANWLAEIGYNYSLAGENLAMGFPDAPGVMTGWANSPTHYANLIDNNFKDIGVGVVMGQYQNADTILVAQFFGTPPTVKQQAAAVTTTKKPVVVAQNQPVAKPQPVAPVTNTNAVTPQVAPEVIEANPSAEAIAPVEPTINLPIAGQIKVNLAEPGVISLQPSSLQQYNLAKEYQPPLVKALLDISSIYYKILLVIAVISLLLNVFIEIRKQHPHVIASTLGLIALLVVFILV